MRLRLQSEFANNNTYCTHGFCFLFLGNFCTFLLETESSWQSAFPWAVRLDGTLNVRWGPSKCVLGNEIKIRMRGLALLWPRGGVVRPHPQRTHTGNAKQMESVCVNGSVHTARKQHQRVCVVCVWGLKRHPLERRDPMSSADVTLHVLFDGKWPGGWRQPENHLKSGSQFSSIVPDVTVLLEATSSGLIHQVKKRC